MGLFSQLGFAIVASSLMGSAATAVPTVIAGGCRWTKSVPFKVFDETDPLLAPNFAAQVFVNESSTSIYVAVFYRPSGDIEFNSYASDTAGTVLSQDTTVVQTNPDTINSLHVSIPFVSAAHRSEAVNCDLTIDMADKFAKFTRLGQPGGAVFERTQYGGFKTAWKAPNGLIWSGYEGAFANDGPDLPDGPESVVVDSPATRACQAIGGRLPTLQDYRTLMDEIAKTNAPGVDIFRVISNGAVGRYWTATAQSPAFARIMQSRDTFGDLVRRTDRWSVRCVSL